MDIRIVNDKFAVAPQITADDIAEIKSLGYIAVINNRPDGEVVDQPATGEIKATANAAGLDYYDLPINSGTLPMEAIAETRALLEKINGPVFAFCRSGTRSITLWALSQKGIRNSDEVISEVQNAGYNLPFLAEFLES